jgi:glycerophosphoryl diester phosphodiesterase
MPRKGWLVTDPPDGGFEAAIAKIDPKVTPLWTPRWDEEIITPERVAACHARGIEVAVWTVNDAASAWAALGRGVDYVYTDRPTALIKEMACFK